MKQSCLHSLGKQSGNKEALAQLSQLVFDKESALIFRKFSCFNDGYRYIHILCNDEVDFYQIPTHIAKIQRLGLEKGRIQKQHDAKIRIKKLFGGRGNIL